MAEQNVGEVIGLEELERDLRKLERLGYHDEIVTVLFEGGKVLERVVKQNIRQQHLILTGNYRASVATDKRRDEVWIWTAVIYAAIHEFGGIIRARRKPYLVFEVDGHLVRVKSVTIPARPHWRPAMTESREEMIDTISTHVRRRITDIAAGARIK